MHIKEADESKKDLDIVELKLKVLPSKKDLDELENEIKTIEVDAIPKIREQRGRLEGFMSFFETAISTLKRKDDNTFEVKCPICQRTVLKATGEVKTHYEEMQHEISVINNDIASQTMRRNELVGRRKQTDDERKSLEERRAALRAQIVRKESELVSAKRGFERISKSLDPLLKEHKNLDDELAKITSELKNIGTQRSKLGQDENKLFNERGEIIQQLTIFDREIRRLQEELSEGSVEKIEETFLPVDKVVNLYVKWVQELHEAGDVLKEDAIKQKKEAAKRFNAKIKDLLWKLGFTDFEDVWLDEVTYNLNVLREKGQRPQAPSSLSTSEKYVLATLLQLAVKDAYMPDNPFLVIDEVVLNFDKSRIEKIMNYLSEIAKERNWFVIMTRLGDVEKLKVSYV